MLPQLLRYSKHVFELKVGYLTSDQISLLQGGLDKRGRLKCLSGTRSHVKNATRKSMSMKTGAIHHVFANRVKPTATPNGMKSIVRIVAQRLRPTEIGITHRSSAKAASPPVMQSGTKSRAKTAAPQCESPWTGIIHPALAKAVRQGEMQSGTKSHARIAAEASVLTVIGTLLQSTVTLVNGPMLP